MSISANGGSEYEANLLGLRGALLALQQTPEDRERRLKVQKEARQVINHPKDMDVSSTLNNVLVIYLQIEQKGGFVRSVIPSTTQELVLKAFRHIGVNSRYNQSDRKLVCEYKLNKGKVKVTVCPDGTIQKYNVEKKYTKILRPDETTEKSDQKGNKRISDSDGTIVEYCIFPDGTTQEYHPETGYMRTTYLDGRIEELEATTGYKKTTFPDGTTQEYHPETGYMKTTYLDGRIEELEATTGYKKTTFPDGAADGFTGVVWQKDGSTFVVRQITDPEVAAQNLMRESDEEWNEIL